MRALIARILRRTADYLMPAPFTDRALPLAADGQSSTGIGQRIRAIRNNLSREIFARQLGVHPNTLARYENEERDPDIRFLQKLCSSYPHLLDPAWLLTGKSSEPVCRFATHTPSADAFHQPKSFPRHQMPLSSRAEIGARLKEERQKLSISQAQLGKLCGVSGRTVLTWEMGESKLPAQQLLALANHGIDSVYVFCGERISYEPRDITFQPPY